MITEAYRIVRLRGTPAIVCLVCDTFSFHLEAVTMHRCEPCGLFLDELPDHYRRPPRQVRNLPGWQLERPVTDPRPEEAGG